MKNINDEWILLSNYDIQLNTEAISNLPQDPNVGCVYFDYLKTDGTIKHNRYMHILLSENIELNHLLIRSDLKNEIKNTNFETMLNIYNKRIVRHIPIIAFELK